MAKRVKLEIDAYVREALKDFSLLDTLPDERAIPTLLALELTDREYVTMVSHLLSYDNLEASDVIGRLVKILLAGGEARHTAADVISKLAADNSFLRVKLILEFMNTVVAYINYGAILCLLAIDKKIVSFLLPRLLSKNTEDSEEKQSQAHLRTIFATL